MPFRQIDLTHLALQTALIHGANLVEQDAGGFACEFHFWAAAEGLAFAGEGGDDDAG